jgi:D-xylose 1-dehydrogenase (NADP+, D-xylono-1,5-lactone-forming)
LPNALHAEWTIRALEAGLPVLCEKPFTTSAGEARAVAEAAQRTNCLAVEAFMYRHHPMYDRVLSLIHEGAIGTLVSMAACFTFRLDDPRSVVASPELGGGALLDVGCYPVNLARLVAGQEPHTAVALARRTTVDTSFFGLLGFPGGFIASVECSIECHERQHASITGTDGTIVLESPWFPGADASRFTIFHEGEGRPPTSVSCPGGDAYRLEVEDFARAVTTGTPPRWGIADAVANMASIDALFAAAAGPSRETPQRDR